MLLVRSRRCGRRAMGLAAMAVLLLLGCGTPTTAMTYPTAPPDTSFHDSQRVTIRGYDGIAKVCDIQPGGSTGERPSGEILPLCPGLLTVGAIRGTLDGDSARQHCIRGIRRGAPTRCDVPRHSAHKPPSADARNGQRNQAI